MRAIVLYSTLTGNTKRIAEAITETLPQGTPCLSVSETPENINSYDCVFIGFWVDRGTADNAAQAVLKKLENKYVAIFATLGADPKSEHALQSLKNAEKFLPNDKEAAGLFICQGAIDPKLIERMFKQFPEGHPHGRSAESEARHAQAASHPDVEDIAAAKVFAESVLQKITQ